MPTPEVFYFHAVTLHLYTSYPILLFFQLRYLPGAGDCKRPRTNVARHAQRQWIHHNLHTRKSLLHLCIKCLRRRAVIGMRRFRCSLPICFGSERKCGNFRKRSGAYVDRASRAALMSVRKPPARACPRRRFSISMQLHCIYALLIRSFYSSSSGIFLEQAMASAPGPMWHDTLNDSGFITISMPGKAACTSA